MRGAVSKCCINGMYVTPLGQQVYFELIYTSNNNSPLTEWVEVWIKEFDTASYFDRIGLLVLVDKLILEISKKYCDLTLRNSVMGYLRCEGYSRSDFNKLARNRAVLSPSPEFKIFNRFIALSVSVFYNSNISSPFLYYQPPSSLCRFICFC